MPNEGSLQYLPSPAEILKRMKEVSQIWGIAGLPEIVNKDNHFYLPVKSGSITLTAEADSCLMKFDSFPYSPVHIEQVKDSLSWTIIEGNNNSIDNAIRMTDILFMNEESLYSYVNKFMSFHKLVPSNEYSKLAMGHFSQKSMMKAGSDSE